MAKRSIEKLADKIINLSPEEAQQLQLVIKAKMLPEMPISEKEFELKDKLIRSSILATEEDVKEIKEDMKYLRDKIDKMD